MKTIYAALLCAFALCLSAFGQMEHHHQPNLVVLVDGSKTPELIPAKEAWRQMIFRFATHATPNPIESARFNHNFFFTELTKKQGDDLVAALKGVREELDAEQSGDKRNVILDRAVSTLYDKLTIYEIQSLDRFASSMVASHMQIYGEAPEQSKATLPGGAMIVKVQGPPPTCHYSFTSAFDFYPSYSTQNPDGGSEPQPGDLATLMTASSSVVDNSGCGHSQYTSTTLITRPDYVQGTSGIQTGLEATATVSINTNGTAQGIPQGNYTGQTTLSYYCPYINSIAVFGGGQTFGLYVAATAFRNPAFIGLMGLTWGCYYSVTNCIPPAVPTCPVTGGVGSYFSINLYPNGCAKYVQSFFAREVLLGKSYCYPIALTVLSGPTGGLCF